MKKATVGKLLKKFRKYAPLFALVMILSAAYAVFSLYIPRLFGDAVDLIIGKNNVDFGGLSVIFVKIAVCAAAAALIQWCMSAVNNKAAFGIVGDIREEMFDKIQRLPVSYLDSHSEGDTLSRLTSDAEQFSDGLLLGFTQLFSGVCMIIGTLVFMLIANPTVSIVVIVLTPVSLFTAKIIANKTYGMFAEQAKDRAEETSFVNEMIGEEKTVFALGGQEQAKARFRILNEKLRRSSQKAVFSSSLTNPTTRAVNAIVYAAVALTGALTVISGGMTVGALSSFLSYASKYTKPFNEISGVMAELQNAFACAERIFAFTEEPEETKETGEGFEKEDGSVVMDRVSFSYSPEKPLIRDLCFEAAPGKHTAIVGPTGCGKTTLINLLMRFYDVNAGSIKVCGSDIRDVGRAELRSLFGMVLQDTWLRYGTVADNIALGCPGAGREKVIAAAKAAHAHGFITKLPDGYDTVLEEGGGGLSQGQKQLLCIARVMITEPKILILDEATSSVDTMTEKKIQKAFDEMTEGKTSFIVAHRLSTVHSADEILVMKDGDIIERGTHNELIGARGFYEHLYQSQFRQGKMI